MHAASARVPDRAIVVQAINEGGLVVHPFHTTLTPSGQVLQMYARHQNAQHIPSPDSEDVVVLISLQERSQGALLLVTLANRNWTNTQEVKLHIKGRSVHLPTHASVTALVSHGPAASSHFEEHTFSVMIPADGTVTVSVHAFSVMQLSMHAIAVGVSGSGELMDN